jgi:hypothetical protein
MPTVKVFVRRAALCLLLCSCSVEIARAQAATAPCSKVNEIKDFIRISDMRDKVLVSIAGLEKDIKSLDELIPGKLEDAKKELQAYRKDLKVIEQKQAKTADPDSDTADLLNDEITALETKIEDYDKNTADRRKKLDELATNKAELECLQERIRSLLTPEQDFKLTMSKYFAGLVGLVILGFFVMAGWDVTVRRAIFSGAQGIQFLTLFSIVIAIILFGITGILQDKELAALLGGLSGYILGRYNSPDPKKDDEPDDSVNSPP